MDFSWHRDLWNIDHNYDEVIYSIADIDECGSNPCHNNASCVNEVAQYACECLPGYTGTDCEIGMLY